MVCFYTLIAGPGGIDLSIRVLLPAQEQGLPIFKTQNLNHKISAMVTM